MAFELNAGIPSKLFLRWILRLPWKRSRAVRMLRFRTRANGSAAARRRVPASLPQRDRLRPSPPPQPQWQAAAKLQILGTCPPVQATARRLSGHTAVRLRLSSASSATSARAAFRHRQHSLAASGSCLSVCGACSSQGVCIQLSFDAPSRTVDMSRLA